MRASRCMPCAVNWKTTFARAGDLAPSADATTGDARHRYRKTDAKRRRYTASDWDWPRQDPVAGNCGGNRSMRTKSGWRARHRPAIRPGSASRLLLRLFSRRAGLLARLQRRRRWRGWFRRALASSLLPPPGRLSVRGCKPPADCQASGYWPHIDPTISKGSRHDGHPRQVLIEQRRWLGSGRWPRIQDAPNSHKKCLDDW
jgi:hypothetical protein